MTDTDQAILRRLELELEAANRNYRDAVAKVTGASLLVIARRTLADFPDATGLEVDYSDQGPYMTPSAVHVDGDRVDDVTFDELAEALFDPCSNLDGDAHEFLWQAYVVDSSDPRRQVLDLGLILRTAGQHEAWKAWVA